MLTIKRLFGFGRSKKNSNEEQTSKNKNDSGDIAASYSQADFDEIDRIQRKIRGSTPLETDIESREFWADLLRLSELLYNLEDLPLDTEGVNELKIQRKITPPFDESMRWYQYRGVRVRMAKHLHQQKKFEDALGLWFEVGCIDFSEITFAATKEEAFSFGVKTSIERGNINQQDVKFIFTAATKNFANLDLHAAWKHAEAQISSS